ncbi:MAG TPA: hypothetical protein PLV08_14915 [Flavobacteriales bacterium]|jgi:hypothetical protein|nr:hypothetical protein [Flavobacteriales bacterium]MBK6551620.1 hypothetical protein [Flavobacteriales bacterium]MBK7101636.1 hypothetical protein [Flavobacteriales bacterium]MBK7112341.1 hypothetical protein [Flavobacteriales bacterium]MBK7481654.1 hypothetical protein [Flavobacteriales bacterium]
MTAIDLQSEIQQLLRKEKNITVLEAIRMLLLREEQRVDEDLSDEEVAELDAQRADRISGKVKFIPEEESIRMIRAGRKG